MSRDSNINQFIPLHFYELSEKLPDDNDDKIIIIKCHLEGCENQSWVDFAHYDKNDNRWYSYENDFYNDEIIAWASFSPEWVTGNYPGEWGKQ